MPDTVFDEETLREAVRRGVAEGRLPCRAQDRTWAGKGTGLDCVVCDRPITSLQVEFELQFAAEPSRLILRMHRECLAAWERECLSAE
jgi:hypothetical protein